MVLGPALHVEHKGPHAPLDLTVALEQMGVADAVVVVQVEVAVDAVEAVVELDDRHFCIDEVQPAYEAGAAHAFAHELEQLGRLGLLINLETGELVRWLRENPKTNGGVLRRFRTP